MPPVTYRSQAVDGLDIFYREAGPADAPAILLLHGFPTSSHMYRDLMPLLADRYRVIAPDYPGYGGSSAPDAADFAYSFDRLAAVMAGFVDALGLDRHALYLQDFGGPVGFRLAASRPERVTALVVQNAVAHEVGLSAAMDPARAYWADRNPETEAAMRGLLTLETTRFQYLTGAADPCRISPDAWIHAQYHLDRPSNDRIQLDLLHDYQSNIRAYPAWQDYLRRHQPPLLIVWGRHDPFFTPAGAEAYLGDVPAAELHFLNTGHFALEEEAATIAGLMRPFLDRAISRA